MFARTTYTFLFTKQIFVRTTSLLTHFCLQKNLCALHLHIFAVPKTFCAYYLHTFVITFRLFFALTTNLQHLFSLQLLTVRDVTSTVFRLQFLRKKLRKFVQSRVETSCVFKTLFPLLFTPRGTFFNVSLAHTPPWTCFASVLTVTIFFFFLKKKKNATLSFFTVPTLFLFARWNCFCLFLRWPFL